MAEDSDPKAFRLGAFAEDAWGKNSGGPEVWGTAIAALWALGALVYLVLAGPGEGPRDPLRPLVALLVIFLPAGFIWLAALLLQVMRRLDAQSEAVQNAVDTLRRAETLRAQNAVIGLRDGAPAAADDGALPVPTPIRGPGPRAYASPAPEPRPTEATDPNLALFDDLAPPAIDVAVLIRALHFPETAEDAAGFDALRTALRHHPSSRVIMSAQDVLTFLSQDGIYMDDLLPDRAKPEIWRRFAHGTRGREVSELGGIRDRAALALSARRMREEPIFRDAA
ncbi:MAG: hypothetical protein AAF871_03610, partial [Pseudomonadota bacterium]